MHTRRFSIRIKNKLKKKGEKKISSADYKVKKREEGDKMRRLCCKILDEYVSYKKKKKKVMEISIHKVKKKSKRGKCIAQC